MSEMPDPVRSSPSASPPPLTDPSAAEVSAQMCLSPAHPSAPPSLAPNALPSAVSSLVARFTTASPAPPESEPSFFSALLHCGFEVGTLVATSALVLGSAPETFGASLLGALRIGLAAESLQRCVEHDEERQTKRE